MDSAHKLYFYDINQEKWIDIEQLFVHKAIKGLNNNKLHARIFIGEP